MKWAWVAAGVLVLGVTACNPMDPLARARAVCGDVHADAAARVDACTDVIDSGKAEGADRAAVLANRGDAHALAHEVTPALRDYEAALRLDEKNAMATQGRALILIDSGQLDAAEPLVDRLIANEGDLAQAYLMKGRILFARGDFTNAVTQFDQALAKDGRLSQALALRGRSKGALGDTAGARADYDAAIAISPPRADALAWRCWQRLMELKDADDRDAVLASARQDAEAAVHADERFVEGETCLGIVRLRAGQWGDAKTAFDTALSAEPGNPIALFGRGVARRRGGDGEGSRDIYQAISFNSHVRELYLSLGVETY